MGNKLPKNWVEIKLKEVSNYKKGKKPKHLDEIKFEGSVPYLDIKAFEKDIIRRYADVASSNLIEKSDIGIVWDGARSGWVSTGKEGAVGSTIAILKPIAISPTYFFNFLKSKYNYLNSNTRGTGIPHVDPKVLWDIDIPLPPLAEQQRIVVKLDSLLGHLEEVKSRMEKIPQLLKNFRQAILTQAVTGKLTEEWRVGKELGDVDLFLDEIYENRDLYQRKVEKKYLDKDLTAPRKPSQSILDGSHIPISIPKQWKDVRLGDLIVDLTDYHANGSYVKLKANVTLNEKEDYACMIRSTNFEKNNFADLLIYINEKAYNFMHRSKLYGGEILISKIGNAGSVYLMPNLNRPASLAMNLFALRINDLVNNKFLYYYLSSNSASKLINKYVRGVATKSIDKISIRSLMVGLPAIQEQTEIVKRVESFFSKVDNIEKRYQELKKQVDSLPQAILAKAFKGELVEQLPTDGHAKDLLKEIAKLKAEVKPRKIVKSSRVGMVAEDGVKYGKKK